jgi:MscS family membrane protein
VAEDLNLRIMDIIAKAGTGIAIPSQALYIQRGKGLDEANMREAEDHVREWKKAQALFIPAFPQEKIDELRGSLDYPPIGSPDAVSR